MLNKNIRNTSQVFEFLVKLFKGKKKKKSVCLVGEEAVPQQGGQDDRDLPQESELVYPGE